MSRTQKECNWGNQNFLQCETTLAVHFNWLHCAWFSLQEQFSLKMVYVRLSSAFVRILHNIFGQVQLGHRTYFQKFIWHFHCVKVIVKVIVMSQWTWMRWEFKRHFLNDIILLAITVTSVRTWSLRSPFTTFAKDLVLTVAHARAAA